MEDLVRELTVDAYDRDEGDSTADELTGLLDALEKEKRSLVAARDSLFNKYFGSIFRAGYGDVSMYGSTLKRSTDIYTDRLDRLLGYSPNHRFYPPSYRRRLERLPHERRDGAYERSVTTTTTTTTTTNEKKKKKKKKQKTENRKQKKTINAMRFSHAFQSPRA